MVLGEGLEIVAYHSVSTGVGGVKIEDGEISHSSIGFEPGHQIDRTVNLGKRYHRLLKTGLGSCGGREIWC